MLKRSLSQAIQHNARAFVCREPTFNTPVTMFRIPHAVASNILEADFCSRFQRLVLGHKVPGCSLLGARHQCILRRSMRRLLRERLAISHLPCIPIICTKLVGRMQGRG
jgi:hypothetical protein